MTYQQCLDWLYSQLPMYQRTGSIAYKVDIGNIVNACEQLGNPQNSFKSIHIAGTNGKGSTSHMIASIFQEAGYKTGLYTSPHLKDFRERVRVNGRMIRHDKVIEFVKSNKEWFTEIGMSFFEMTVALAFHHFSEEKVDIAIIEVGLGGRLDSTNIILPELSVITNIGMDHTDLLGDSIHKIAKEKAGIIKNNTAVLIGRKQEEITSIFEEYAQQNNADLYYSDQCDFETDLKGKYQLENKNTAFTAMKILKNKGWNVQEKHIKQGLENVQKNTSISGRWMIINHSPLTICDTGHNEDGIRLIVEQLKQTPHNDLHLVFGVVNDKSIAKVLELLPKQAQYYFCQAKIPRAMNAEELQKMGGAHQLFGNSFNTVESALKKAQSNAKTGDLVFVGGSTFVVAEVL
jgi:dihydrofolate synthase / folylpolyglutamate synthase